MTQKLRRPIPVQLWTVSIGQARWKCHCGATGWENSSAASLDRTIPERTALQNTEKAVANHFKLRHPTNSIHWTITTQDTTP